jgi:hypothetical protein
MKHNLTILMAALMLGGCVSQSQIQSEYVAQQNACRSEAARFLEAARGATIGMEDKTAAGTYFSECMNKAGWRVAVPKPGGQMAQGPVPNPPSGSPSTNPIASATPAPGYTIGAVSPSEGTATLLRGPHTLPGASVATPQAAPPPMAYAPPSGAPSVNPSAAATALPPPARYLPARPATVTTPPPYGYGAGRQF